MENIRGQTHEQLQNMSVSRIWSQKWSTEQDVCHVRLLWFMSYKTCFCSHRVMEENYKKKFLRTPIWLCEEPLEAVKKRSRWFSVFSLPPDCSFLTLTQTSAGYIERTHPFTHSSCVSLSSISEPCFVKVPGSVSTEVTRLISSHVLFTYRWTSSVTSLEAQNHPQPIRRLIITLFYRTDGEDSWMSFCTRQEGDASEQRNKDPCLKFSLTCGVQTT